MNFQGNISDSTDTVPNGDISIQQPYDSTWETTCPVAPTPKAFLELLEGRTPLIMQAEFLSQEACTRLEQELESRFSPYLHATGPSVDKVGIAQFEFQAQSQEDMKSRKGDEKQHYFAAVQTVRNLHEELSLKTGINAFARVLALIRTLAPPDWEICLASEGASPNQQYFAGIVRGINNGTPIHCDWVPYDLQDESWAIKRVTHQAVFNLYLTTVSGGGTVIHDVQWTPQALAHRDPESYGYFGELVKGKKEAPFRPRAGDLVFFNSRNMHHVEPVSKDCRKRRMAMASFFGVLPPEREGGKTKLVFWS